VPPRSRRSRRNTSAKIRAISSTTLQLAASIPNFLCQEQVSLGHGYLKKPFEVEKGYVKIPTGPGLGIELDDDALADKIGHDWRNHVQCDLDDGSVKDW